MMLIINKTFELKGIPNSLKMSHISIVDSRNFIFVVIFFPVKIIEHVIDEILKCCSKHTYGYLFFKSWLKYCNLIFFACDLFSQRSREHCFSEYFSTRTSPFGVIVYNTGLDKVCSRILCDAEQFVSNKSRNENVANKSWFTVEAQDQL